MIVKQENVRGSDLTIGTIYEGGPSLSDEPMHLLLGTANRGGIRPKNTEDGHTAFIALHSTSNVVEWPDTFDGKIGRYTYFGDNKYVDKDLNETPGNKAIQRVFKRQFETKLERLQSPPFFVFTSVSGMAPYSVKFEGLAVPGSSSPEIDWCTAKFHKQKGSKFQNYQFQLTILACRRIRQEWVKELLAGNPVAESCPEWYSEWLETGARVPYTHQ